MSGVFSLLPNDTTIIVEEGYPKVDFYADLPTTGVVVDDIYLVRNNTTFLGFVTKNSGLYRVSSITPLTWVFEGNPRERLDELNDTNITTPTNKQPLVYNGIKWTNGNSILLNDLIFITNPTNPSHTEGSLHWNTQDHTLDLHTEIEGVSNQLGQELTIRCRNSTGSSISNGDVVYISGALGQRPQITKALANSFSTSYGVIGVATHDIDNNADGYVTINGLVRDINTGSFLDGDIVYLSTSVAGGLTKTKPNIPNMIIRIGTIIYAHNTQGIIAVSVRCESQMFGNIVSGNYTGFEVDGTMIAVGTASCHRDEYPASALVPAGGATAPDQVDYTIGGVQRRVYSFDGINTEERLSGSFEIPHDYKTGSDIEIHLHFRPSSNNSGNVKFFFDWEYSGVNTAPQAETSLSLIKTINANEQYFHFIANFGVLPANGYVLGDKIGFNLRRTPSDVQDTYGDDIIFEQIAMHIEVDMLGSRQRYIK